uniref:Uncharacterized protein n=1 Tax=Fagus sylvatica TaxID=28930 RepID=A0A2N9J9N3_FAGSY
MSVCTNKEAEVIIVEGLSRITAAKVEPFRIVSDALPLFTSWWEALMLSFNLPETLKLTVWEVCPHCLAYKIIGDVNTTSSEEEETVNARPLQTVLLSPKRSNRTPTRGKRKIILPSSNSEPEEQLKRKPKQQKVKGKEKEVLEGEAPTQTKTSSCTQVFKRRSKGIVIKDSTVEKDLASALAKANQVIASQRQEITTLSIKAHQDAVSIITKEIPMHLSSPQKKQKLAAEKERAIKIKQEQASAKIEVVIPKQLEVEADPLEVPTVLLVEETKEETTTPVISTPELEINESTLENVNPSTALVLATLTPDAKPLSQQPLLDTQIIKVDIEDLSEPEVDQLIKRASSALEEMKSASKASTSSSSKAPTSLVSQGMSAFVVMRSILKQPLDNLVYDSELRNKFQECTNFLLSQSNFLSEDMLGMLALFSKSLDSKLLQISTTMNNEKEIQSIQKGYDEKITAKSEFQQEFEQTLKKYEDTKQEISKVRKEFQRLENVKDLTQMKLQDLLKQKDNINDSSTELSLEEKITSLTTKVSRLRRIPEAVSNNLRNSFNNFQL